MRFQSHIQQRFTVEFAYPVVFTEDVFAPDDETLLEVLQPVDSRRTDVLCFVDGGLAEARPGFCAGITDWFAARSDQVNLALAPVVLPGGEEIKNDYRLTMQIVDTITEHRLCRHSYVLAVGGGAVLDAVGFAASIVHRGLRTIRLPSTVLAQCDAGLGVKNGMNLHGTKNMIGTFHPPHAVLNSLNWLDSLSFEDWIGGVSEAFKVALIKDEPFFRFLCESAEKLRNRDGSVMQQVIQWCAELHLDHIRSSGDAFERGSTRPLDFGHWSAHKLEIMSGCRISHGEAVAIGVALDCLYAAQQGFLSPEDCEQALRGLSDCGFHLWRPEVGRTLGDGTYELVRGIEEFREHVGGELSLTFPCGAGKKQEVSAVNLDDLAASIQALERFQAARLQS